MSDDKCPRCGSPAHESPWADDAETWHCGTYRAPSGHLYESELCETRQELQFLKRLIREDDKVRREADQKSEEKYLMMRDSLGLLKEQLAHSKAELAKRERALEFLVFKLEPWQFMDLGRIAAGRPSLSNYFDADDGRTVTELAEWLKNRGKS